MDVKNEIIQYAKALGLEHIGFTKCRGFEELRPFFVSRKENNLENVFEERDLEKRINPNFLNGKGKTIISVAFPYYREKDNYSKPYFSLYCRAMDYHLVVKSYLEKLSSYINKLGGNAEVYVDNNSLPERYIAYLCGLGFQGKNQTFITEEYGSYVFLGEVVTDLYIEEDTPKKTMSCGSCTKCIKACPTGSIKEDGCNPNICLSYITQEKQLEESWFDALGGRLFGCDTCQGVCPFNSQAQASPILEFKPYDFMEKPMLEELLNLDKNSFLTKYAKTAAGWRGKNLLQRNALIYAASVNKLALHEEMQFNSPYVSDYYNRLLKFFKL